MGVGSGWVGVNQVEKMPADCKPWGNHNHTGNMTMTDYQYELKQLKNQLFDLSTQFDELYASYDSLEVLIIDGEAVHCRAVLTITAKA